MRAVAKLARGERTDDDGVRLVYWVARTKGRKRAEKALGWMTRDEASLALADLVRLGGIERDTEADRAETVRDLLALWAGHIVEERPDLADRTIEKYLQSGRRLTGLIGGVEVAQLNRGFLEQLRGQMLRTLSPRTVRYDLNRLSTAWRWARSRGLVPARDLVVPKVRVPKAEMYTPTQGEIRAVIREVRKPWRRLALRVMFATGARVGEVSALRRIDIDERNATLQMVGKTGPRLVPVRPGLVRDLLSHAASHTHPLVMGVGYGTFSSGLRVEVHKHCDALGITRFGFHGIRRAAVDALLRSGIDVGTAARLLGHTPAVMLQHYRQATLDDMRDAVMRTRMGLLEDGDVIELRKRR